ncbi:PLC-like protein [Mya arenaria]|uniref:PLC-like protein n=1 Tax=Mya arenaria TaxID=6604 RepID=A0ABY7G0K0_MYAAR|nr:PLC-like protein [Mya arenaria]
MRSSWHHVVMKLCLMLVCHSLLQLLANVRGDISVQDYSKYTGSSAITGTSLGKTSARSVVRCSTLCSRHEEEKGERCHAARYHGETRACELMSRSGEGAEEWLVDGQWNIYVIQMGATLAVITDHGENGFLKGLLESVYGSHYYWLGANDVLQEGVFKWETGEDWGFTAWAVTPWVQPLGNAGYNCLGIWVIGYDGWVDYLCEHGTWYVCEKDA